MDAHVSALKNQNDECLVAMVRTVLYMAQENIPTSKFSSLAVIRPMVHSFIECLEHLLNEIGENEK